MHVVTSLTQHQPFGFGGECFWVWEIGIHYVLQAGLKLTVFLPHSLPRAGIIAVHYHSHLNVSFCSSGMFFIVVYAILDFYFLSHCSGSICWMPAPCQVGAEHRCYDLEQGRYSASFMEFVLQLSFYGDSIL
jgi:hypothetical protein